MLFTWICHLDLSILKLIASCDGCHASSRRRLLNLEHLVVLLAGPISHSSTRCMDFVEIFNIILDLSITCFSHFSGCWASFMFIVINLSWNAITCFLESSWVWDRFLLFGQSSKMTKTSYSVPFIKKTLVNQVYIRIWSFWVTFTVLQWLKKNSKISQFSSFLLSSEYAIWVNIWQWLKLLNYFKFIKKTLLDYGYIWTWSSWLTFTVLQWMKTNFKISQFSRFLLRSEYAIEVKIWKWLKLLSSVPFIKKTLVNHVYIGIWSFWVTFTVLQWMKTNFKTKSIFKISANVWVYDWGQN